VVQGVHYEDIPEVYDGCKAFVAPMVCATGYDITVAEAMARRRPSITSPVGAYFFEGLDKPWIQHVPMEAPEALAEAMLAPLPKVPYDAAEVFRAEHHVEKWLEAVA
jgi:glycosyltransferase involved in cell wall biosynthesis